MLHCVEKLQMHMFLKSQLKTLVVLTLENILYRQNCNIEAESMNIFYFVISHLAAPRSTLCYCQIAPNDSLCQNSFQMTFHDG